MKSFLNKVSGLTGDWDFNTGVSLWILRIFYYRKPPVASVNLLFLIKSNVGWFLLKRVDLVIVRVIYTLSVETIPTRFYWLTCRNQELVQSKLPQQRSFVLILGFWQCRHVLCKLTRGYIKEVIWERLTALNVSIIKF